MDIVKVHDKSFGLSITSEDILTRVSEIADKINYDFKGRSPVFIVVLNGAFIFASDLLKRVTLNCHISFVKISSYDGLKPSENLRKTIGLIESVKDKEVIIIEDIVDSGNTMEYLINDLSYLQPTSIKIASFFFKPDSFNKDFKIDYIGFQIPPDFVVGYGLDYNGFGRNLPDIYSLIK